MHPIARYLCPLLLLALFAPPSFAQETGGRQDHNLETFKSIDLPSPNSYRAASGEPGPDYWQQRVDYKIQVALDPSSNRLTGSETITYTNNSPHELDYLWIQLDQNLFKPGSRGSTMQPAESRWRGAFEGGGFDISRVELLRDGSREAAKYLIDDTRMRIALDQPMPAGGSVIEIELDFGFTIPQYGADRMGRLDVQRGTVYEFAQWYPRMYVFDDVNGWNPLPYLGQGEFYLGYGDFDMEITIPRDFIVVSTGELLNDRDVLTQEQRSRLDRARGSAETVMIVAPEEVGRQETRPAGDGPLTWKFRAENVRDVAWAASQAFIWDAASWEDVLTMSVYPHEGLGTPGNPGWEESTQYVRHSIQHYSTMWYPYPYPVAINVAGIVGGMEYPMIVFCGVRARGQALFGVTDHEFGHEWFPMIVGSDERRHAWMDEGFNTFMNYYSNVAFYGENAERTGRLTADYIAGLMESEISDQPIFANADLLRREGLGFLAYRKPAKGLLLLREYILGPERFDPAFREYIRRWAYKHPQPADFFRTIEDVAGERLDWFWRGWFFSTDVLDQAVTNVTVGEAGSIVTVEHQEGLVMPVELEISFTNGSSERRRIPVEAFATTNVFSERVNGSVAGVTIDPDGLLPDIDRGNNSWQSANSSN